MCGICGVWRGTTHWTSKSQNASVFSVATSSSMTLRERAQQSAALNKVTRPLGVTIRDWEGTQWVIEFGDGAAVIADSIPAIWAALELKLRRKIDPLGAPFVNPALQD